MRIKLLAALVLSGLSFGISAQQTINGKLIQAGTLPTTANQPMPPGTVLCNATGASAVPTACMTIPAGSLPALPPPTPATLGGVTSKAPVTHQFVNQIGTDGSVGTAQPAAADVTGLAPSATIDTTNASNIASGTLGVGRLPAIPATSLQNSGGTPSATTYFRGDNTWVTPAGAGAAGNPGALQANNAGSFTGIPITYANGALNFPDGSLLSTSYGSGNYAFAGVTNFGDSVTVGLGSLPNTPTFPPANVGTPNTLTNGYVALMDPLFGGIPTNYGFSGDQAGDQAQQAVANTNPSYFSNIAYTTMVGINNADLCGNTSPCLSSFTLASSALYLWLGTPNQNKIIFGTNTQSVSSTGTWSPASNFQANYELSTVDPTATVTWTTFVPSKTMALAWTVFAATDTATAALSCDSGAVTDTLTANVASISLSRQTVTAFAKVYTFASSATHTCTLTQTSSAGNPFNLIFAGTPPAANTVGSTFGSPTANAPRVFAGGVIRQQSDLKSTVTAAFDAQAQTIVTALNVAGWNNVVFVPVRSYVNTTTDMAQLNATMLNGVVCVGSGAQFGKHPNVCGHQHLADAFLAYAQPVGASSTVLNPNFNYPLAVNTPATVTSVNGLNTLNSSGTLSTAATLGPGLIFGNHSGAVLGFNLGFVGSSQVLQATCSDANNNGFAISSHVNGTLPTSNASFTKTLFRENCTSGQITTGPVTAPTNSAGFFDFNATAKLLSSTSLNAGINLYNNSLTNIGWNVGFVGGQAMNMMYSSTAHGFAVAHYASALPVQQSDFITDFIVSDTLINMKQPIQLGGVLMISTTAPVIASGFGSSPSIFANGTAAFRINVGTGGVASSGVVTMPTAPHGWSCKATDASNNATSESEAFSTSATSVTINNYVRTTGVAGPWVANDLVEVSCTAY